MRIQFLSWLFFVHCVAAEGIPMDSLVHQASIPAQGRILFEQLAQGHMTEQDKDIDTLAQVPNIAPALLELFQRVYQESGDHQQLLAIMRILERRNDLNDDQLDLFRKELRVQWNKKDDARSAVLKERGLRVLANYPGTANEDILLLYLTEVPTIDVVGFSRDAAEGLTKIGTARSLPALDAYSRQHPVGSTRHDAARAAIEAVTIRSR